MGWNTSVLLAEKMSRADMTRLIPDVFSVTKRKVGWEEASSSAIGNSLAIGGLPGWGAIWTLNVQVTTFPEVLEQASQRGRALSLVLSSVSDIFGFVVYANGVEVRRLIREQGQPTEEAGSPIAEESELDWQNSEQGLFDLARRLTGLDVSHFETWETVRFQVASLDF